MVAWDVGREEAQNFEISLLTSVAGLSQCARRLRVPSAIVFAVIGGRQETKQKR